VTVTGQAPPIGSSLCLSDLVTTYHVVGNCVASTLVLGSTGISPTRVVSAQSYEHRLPAAELTRFLLITLVRRP
jgi:hypothetical protein